MARTLGTLEYCVFSVVDTRAYPGVLGTPNNSQGILGYIPYPNHLEIFQRTPRMYREGTDKSFEIIVTAQIHYKKTHIYDD